MNDGVYVFDTNAIRAWARGDRAILRALEGMESPATTLFTLAELRDGALGSARPVETLESIERLLANFTR